jgi:ankyrin repeat protein
MKDIGREKCRCPEAFLVWQAVKNDGQTALHEAAEAGQRDTTQYLLSIGANPQAQDEVSMMSLSLVSLVALTQFLKLST